MDYTVDYPKEEVVAGVDEVCVVELAHRGWNNWGRGILDGRWLALDVEEVLVVVVGMVLVLEEDTQRKYHTVVVGMKGCGCCRSWIHWDQHVFVSWW